MRQRTSMRAYLPPRGAVRAQAPIADTRPVLRSPRPSTSIEPTVTVARLDRPDTASAGVRMPLRRRTTGTAMATWSTRMRSRANRTSAARVRARTNAMSKVMSRTHPSRVPALFAPVPAVHRGCVWPAAGTTPYLEPGLDANPGGCDETPFPAPCSSGFQAGRPGLSRSGSLVSDRHGCPRGSPVGRRANRPDELGRRQRAHHRPGHERGRARSSRGSLRRTASRRSRTGASSTSATRSTARWRSCPRTS